jgi:hypothetical protein
VRSRLLKLDDVAKRLGCDIETLRLRIRSGRLKAAVRGPHGAYFISARSLGLLRVRTRPPRQRRTPTAGDLNVAWRAMERRLRRAPAAHEELVPFLEALKINRPSTWVPIGLSAPEASTTWASTSTRTYSQNDRARATNRATLTLHGTSWPKQFIENDDVTFDDCGARGAGLVSCQGTSRWLDLGGDSHA